MRTSRDEYRNGKLWNGYDYKIQYWVHHGQKDTRTLEELQAEMRNLQKSTATA